MDRVIYKVYKGEPNEITYMTFNIDDAVRKYFMHIRDNPSIQIWRGQRLIGNYKERIFNLKTIKHSLEKMSEIA